MKMEIKFLNKIHSDSGSIVLNSFQDTGFSSFAKNIDKKLEKNISCFTNHMKFKSKIGDSIVVAPVKLEKTHHITVVGCGKKDDLSSKDSWNIGGKICVAIKKAPHNTISIILDDINDDNVAEIAAGIKLKHWTFDKYKTKKKEEDKVEIENLIIVCNNPENVKKKFESLDAVVEGSYMTRTLVSEPSNVLYPETFAEHVQVLSKLGIKIEILDEHQLKDIGMNALVGVGQGSKKDSKFVIMSWFGDDDKDKQPIAFVGKGITFDSGGISLKPSKGMEDMKSDMGGSAVVTGLMKSLALRNAKLNVIGVIALAENMPSGTAQRPGDVVRSYSGQTIEILNTDAEGRLVLADALWYTQEKYQPKIMIDLATLTGAIVVALGHEYAGLFSDDDTLVKQLKSASKKTGEKLWHMPMDEDFDKDINSSIADVKNIGSYGGGSITAAQFLKRFVNKTKWAHIDIAGVTWSEKERNLSEKGATSYGLRLLDQFIRDNYES